MDIRSIRYLLVAAAIWGACNISPAHGFQVPVPLDRESASASASVGPYPAWQSVDGVLTGGPEGNGWGVSPVLDVQQTAVFESTADAAFNGYIRVELVQDKDAPQPRRFRLSYTTASRKRFADGKQDLGSPRIWNVLDVESCYASVPGTTFSILKDRSLVATGEARGSYTVISRLKAKGVTGFRLEVLPEAFADPAVSPKPNQPIHITEFQVFSQFEDPVPARRPLAPMGYEDAVVPEPSTWIGGALLLVPVVVQVFRSRRRSNSS